MIGMSPARGQDDNASPIRYGDQIRPIFNEHCTACHGGVKQAGDVSFVYRHQVLPPDGWVVEPGKPDESILIDRVTSDDPDVVMPPPDHGKALSEKEVALLTEWIRQGAPWDDHWAYVPPRRPETPQVDLEAWPLQPMDHFVLARLERESITPAPDASPSRWLRRVTLDVTGLPPTLEERQRFLSELETAGEKAYQDAVDRLLRSPRFGERWASVWLDQVRYADSKGLGLDARRNVWKYRDWVIDAFNRDLPFDQFTIKQIAGDLLPEPTIEDLIATAAHRVTQTNEEGGTDDEEFRIAAVLDRVNTTWQVWQGVTFGCAQCHNHPYDPFMNDEYYQFAAFFNNTADSDLDQDWPTINVPVDSSDYERASQLDQQIQALNDGIWKEEFSLLADDKRWKPLVELHAKSSNATRLEVQHFDDHDEFHTVGTVSRNADFTLEAPVPADCETITAIRLTAMPQNPEVAVPDSEWGFVIGHIEASLLVPGEEQPRTIELERLLVDEPAPLMDPQQSLNEKSNEGFAAFTRIHYPRQAALLPKSPIEVPDGATLRLVLKHRQFILSAFALITQRGHIAVSDDNAFSEVLRAPSMKDRRERLSQLRTERSKIKSTSVPVLSERPEHLSRPSHVFERGSFLTKGEQVQANTPESFPKLRGEGSADRLALAHWIASPSNPLTARVAVNRIWARLFGVGLVATEEDFGSSGEAPSHPMLLDSLAVRFQEDYGWSVKQVIREIVLSRTYRQTSKIRPELAERDAQNRLLARGPRHRLPAEMVRDQALAVSGLLDDQRHGPPVYPPIPDGVWMPFASWDKWNTSPKESGDRYRRSIYTYTKRSIPYPMFAAFDAPTREFCTPRRLPSNTPLQALMTLNDVTFVECAEALAERMRSSENDLREQIRHGFLRVTCREPKPSEIDELESLCESLASDKDTDALRTVAGVLLNLDEFLTK